MGLWSTIAGRLRSPRLMERMFARFGVREALVERPGGAEALQRATLRCMGCTEGGACASWLDEPQEADSPPSFCRNAALIERLRRETGAPH